jgi:hypothetical protein
MVEQPLFERAEEPSARPGFDEEATVVVEQDGWRSWRTRQAFRWTSADGVVVTVPSGTATDFASVPRPFVWFIPRYGRWTKPAILHDYLWATVARRGELSWHDADRYFREAMAHTEVPLLRRWIMWSMARWAALAQPNGWRGWWRDAPAVLLFTALASVVALPPAILIVPALVLFHAAEWLLYGLLVLGRRPPVKPGIDLKSG